MLPWWHFHLWSFNGVASHFEVVGGDTIRSLEGWLLGAHPGPRSPVAMVILRLCQGCFSLWVERSSPASSYVGYWQLERRLTWCAASPAGSSESPCKSNRQLRPWGRVGVMGSSPSQVQNVHNKILRVPYFESKLCRGWSLTLKESSLTWQWGRFRGICIRQWG